MAKGFVILQRRKLPRCWPAIRLTKSLPYVISRNGIYTHRVRAGHVVLDSISNPQPLHTVIHCWCGQTVITGLKREIERGGDLQALADPEFPICRTCEERAVLQGHPTSALICDREVRFSPPRGSLIRHHC